MAGKPLSVTEWNVEYPTRDRFVAPLYVAAIASLQGWDAPMIVSYAGNPLAPPDHPDARSTWNDPALTALMPAAAMLFRGRHVREAIKTYRFDLTRENLYFERTSPETSVAIRTLVEQSKLTLGLADIPELGWTMPCPPDRPTPSLLPIRGTIFSPRARPSWFPIPASSGGIGRPASRPSMRPSPKRPWGGSGKAHSAARCRLRRADAQGSPRGDEPDGQPIATSRQMLVTAVGQVAASAGGGLPFIAQPIDATLTLRGAAPLRLVPLSPGMLPLGRHGRETQHDRARTERW